MVDRVHAYSRCFGGHLRAAVRRHQLARHLGLTTVPDYSGNDRFPALRYRAEHGTAGSDGAEQAEMAAAVPMQAGPIDRPAAWLQVSTDLVCAAGVGFGAGCLVA